ncbi:hypothetical protein DFH09DRAFT_1190867 [Mycena vulgaris]|nr:hypothetical protein DFH09DRAFT_1190867 [Mycena vulgaris]
MTTSTDDVKPPSKKGIDEHEDNAHAPIAQVNGNTGRPTASTPIDRAGTLSEEDGNHSPRLYTSVPSRISTTCTSARLPRPPLVGGTPRPTRTGTPHWTRIHNPIRRDLEPPHHAPRNASVPQPLVASCASNAICAPPRTGCRRHTVPRNSIAPPPRHRRRAALRPLHCTVTQSPARNRNGKKGKRARKNGTQSGYDRNRRKGEVKRERQEGAQQKSTPKQGIRPAGTRLPIAEAKSKVKTRHTTRMERIG